MVPVTQYLVYFLMTIFLIGCLGAMVVIPVVAIRFASVLFEPDPVEESGKATAESTEQP